MKELEETKKQQEIALIQEQIKTPLFTTDQIAFAIYKFRQLDLSTREAKQALIDGFVNAIYLYDDHAKLILNYKNDTKTITLDELQGSDFNSVTEVSDNYPTRPFPSNAVLCCFQVVVGVTFTQ